MCATCTFKRLTGVVGYLYMYDMYTSMRFMSVRWVLNILLDRFLCGIAIVFLQVLFAHLADTSDLWTSFHHETNDRFFFQTKKMYVVLFDLQCPR